LDGMMDADEAYFKQHGEPLFVSLHGRIAFESSC
jgi:hypothetical protein